MTIAETNRSCPVCGSDDATLSLRKPGLRLVRCRACRMVYASPVSQEFASGEYYLHQTYYTDDAKLEGDFSPVRYEREVRAVLKHLARGKLLDVGCSSGGFIHSLSRTCPGNYEATGIDVSGPALEYAKARGLPVLSADFPRHDFRREVFDAVTFWAVLEHLINPREFLHQAWNVLKPRGLCFVLVPNLQALAVRVLGARYRYILPEHVNYFSSATLKLLLQKPSWQILECRTSHFNPAVLWQDWRHPQTARSGHERADLLRRTTAWKQSGWARPVRPLYRASEKLLSWAGLADNLLLVARKVE